MFKFIGFSKFICLLDSPCGSTLKPFLFSDIINDLNLYFSANSKTQIIQITVLYFKKGFTSTRSSAIQF